MLEDLSDLELIQLVKSNESKANVALQELVNRHSGIYFKIVNKYFNDSVTPTFDLDREFVRSSSLKMIYDCALKFDPNRNVKFCSFVGDMTRYFCLNHINNRNMFVGSTAEELDLLPHSSEDSFHEQIDKALLDSVVAIIKSLPDDNMKKIFELRYLEGFGNKVMPWNLVCQQVKHVENPHKHFSIQGCINLHDKGIKIIKSKLKNSKMVPIGRAS